MQYLLGILIIVAATGLWSWRLRMARDRARAAADMARAAANLPHKLAFRYKAGRNGLTRIEDPREAAAIMMMEVARARGGPLTQKQSDAIDEEIMRHFGFSPSDANELTAHAAWVTNHAPLPEQTMRSLSQLILSDRNLGSKEIIDLDSMLVAVSEAEGVPTRDQLSLLQVYRDRAGLKT
ncbi:hypothetical protein [Hyphomonas johnsonii]|uniref:Co-chaperone DjlA N-terminal domain-containing protein n=1 Tax=Hyphomonas johnsonii MHS-2 TaxID=1280950 RepID=A0A059FNT6_9PROT|nr:hypothetical protein [Hyphomonas johnsonii]KCZ92282.1 hypothetical protein HJO_09614 [Hyphomonas johnsonii MHS-2]